MDENTIITETPADQQDAFLAGWDEDAAETIEQGADQPPVAEGEHAPQSAQTSAGEGAPNEGAESNEQEPSGNAAPPPSAPEWRVRHMDTERVMKPEDVTPELLQKGLDYDRVRVKYDEAKPAMELLTSLAQSANMNVTDYIKWIRGEVHKAKGMSDEDAARAVELEDREAAVAAKERSDQERNAAAAERAKAVRDGLDEFAKAFPEDYEKAKSDTAYIPQSVWNDVASGLSLTAAWARHMVAAAKDSAASAEQAAKTAAQNAHNAARSAGSMQTAGGNQNAKDPFLSGFEDA